MMLFGEIIQRAKSLPKDEGERMLEEALAKGRHRARREDVANLLVHLASYASDAGRHEVAILRLKKAVRLYEGSCGPNDARTAYARSRIAYARERTGDLAGALEALRALEPDDARPTFRWLHIAGLEAKRGDERAASEALEAARRGASSDTHDPLVNVEFILGTARALCARARTPDARALLTNALARTDDVIAGRIRSPSARLPSQVRAQYVAELEEDRRRRLIGGRSARKFCGRWSTVARARILSRRWTRPTTPSRPTAICIA